MIDTHPVTTEPDLPARLRDATRIAHHQVERGSFVQKLVRGQIDRRGYRSYLTALAHVYRALDAGLAAHANHPVVGPFARPELARTAALAADLEHLVATDPAAQTPDLAANLVATPGALQYAAHLRRLADHEPAPLVAHAYVRYLGDLSGGQLMRTAVARALGLSTRGLEFYAFPQIADIDAYKREFRTKLAALPGREAPAIVAEASRAFALNADLLADLG